MTSRGLAVAAVAGLIFAGARPVVAADSTPSQGAATTLEVGGSSERLSNGSPDWTSAYVEFAHRIATQETVYGSLTRDDRFGRGDWTYDLGAAVPLAARTLLDVEGSFSPTHAVLPQQTYAASIERRLAAGWGGTLGVRHRTYPSVDVTQESALVDRYWSRYRAAYTISATQLSNVAGIALGHTLSVTRYDGRDQQNSLTLALDGGREAENTGTRVASSSVAGASLRASRWFDQHFGMSITLSTWRQGASYTRSGVYVGARSRF